MNESSAGGSYGETSALAAEIAALCADVQFAARVHLPRLESAVRAFAATARQDGMTLPDMMMHLLECLATSQLAALDADDYGWMLEQTTGWAHGAYDAADSPGAH